MASFNPKILRGYNNVTKSIEVPKLFVETVTGTTDIEGSYEIGTFLRSKGYDIDNKSFMMIGYSCDYIVGVGQRLLDGDRIIMLHFTGDTEYTPSIQDETISAKIMFALI